MELARGATLRIVVDERLGREANSVILATGNYDLGHFRGLRKGKLPDESTGADSMAGPISAISINSNQELTLKEEEKPVTQFGGLGIAIKAAGVNRADLMQRQGLYPPPPNAPDTMGLECAGIVEAIGKNVSRFKVGDRVCALLAGGGYAEYTAVDEGSVLPIPDDMSFIAAACYPEAMMTVWANVFQRCNLVAGENFLVHGGTSGIGVMAIQMARVAGAKTIFATAGSDEKCQKCIELGADIAINYKTENFVDVISKQGGADVILDMVGGDYVQKNLDVIRTDGRICNIAYQSGSKVNVDLIKLMLKRATLTGSTLRARLNEEKRVIRDAVEKDFWPAVISGRIKPVLDSTFKLSEADAAQARMSKGGHIGKIVLEV